MAEHSDTKLILYQLGELKSAVSEGFAKIEGRFDRVEDRVSSLERFRERQEERDRADATATQNVNSRWVPIVLGLLALGVTIAVALSQGAGA